MARQWVKPRGNPDSQTAPGSGPEKLSTAAMHIPDRIQVSPFKTPTSGDMLNLRSLLRRKAWNSNCIGFADGLRVELYLEYHTPWPATRRR